MTTADIDKVIVEIIPIYTRKKPHPVRQRADCRLEIRYKEGLRLILKKKLEVALLKGEDTDPILGEYKIKVAAL